MPEHDLIAVASGPAALDDHAVPYGLDGRPRGRAVVHAKMRTAVPQDGMLAVVAETRGDAREGKGSLQQGLAKVLALAIVVLRAFLAVLEVKGLEGLCPDW